MTRRVEAAAAAAGQESDPPLGGTDLRLAPAALGTWAAAAAGVHVPPVIAGGLAAGLLAVGAGLLRPGRRRSTAVRLALALSLLCAGVAAGDTALRVLALRSGPVPILGRAFADARVVVLVTADPRLTRPRPGRPGGDLVVVPARVVLVRRPAGDIRVSSPVVLLARDRAWLAVAPGERHLVDVTLRPGDVAEKVAAVGSVRGPPRLVSPAPVWQRAATSLRGGLVGASAGLGPDERAVLPGLVDGDTSRVSAELSSDFRTTGLTHLLAVSGANLAILLAFVLWAARWCGVRGWWLPALGLLTVGGFVLVARPEPSVLRAAAMGLVTLVALGSGRARSGVSALAAAVVGLVLLDPWLATSYGFVLSALATGALLLAAGRWATALQRRGLPRPLAVALAAPAAAQLACAPVVVLLSGQVSLVAVPANLLAAPAVAPATVLGVLALLVAPLSSSAAAILAHLAALPVWWLVRVARYGAAVPAAAIRWPASAWGSLGLAATTVGAVLAAGPVARWSTARWGGRPVALVCVGVLVAAAAGVRVADAGWPPRGWVLVACDVGQGDALVLATVPGSAVVVDAGPDPALVDRCLRRLRVRRVPVLVLTHFHADHVDGVPGVLRGRVVGALEVGPLAEPADRARTVLAAARGRQVPVLRAGVGEHVTVGPVRWEVLWPARVIRGEGSDPNNASVVLLVVVRGLRLLLLGDVETAAQRALLARLGPAGLPGGPVDVLKVAHHGSASQAPGLLAAAAPRAAVISVGPDNDYGHPSPATLRLLASAGVPVWRTDLVGDVAVVAHPGGGLRVVARGR
jgi:competence protein ComEC